MEERRRNAMHDIPAHDEVQAKEGTHDDIVDAVRNLLMAPLLTKLKQRYFASYSPLVSAQEVNNMTIEEIFSKKHFEKDCAKACKDDYACAKLLHKLLVEDAADYKKFMKHLDKIWHTYYSLPSLKVEWQDFAPYRKKYWDSKEGKPRKLSDVMAKEEQAKNPPAPAALVNDVEDAFYEFLESLVNSVKDEFKTSDAFKTLKKPKFKTDKEFAFYIIDERNVDCYIAFEAFCTAKSKEYQQRFICVVLLHKALKNKDNYEVFMTHFLSAYQYMTNKTTIGSEKIRAKMKKCHETYWNSHTNEPRPLGKDVQG